jgi:hypothetical protein
MPDAEVSGLLISGALPQIAWPGCLPLRRISCGYRHRDRAPGDSPARRPTVAGLLRSRVRQRCCALPGGSPAGSAAAARSLTSIQRHRLPGHQVVTTPAQSGPPAPSRRASCRRAKVTRKGRPAARRSRWRKRHPCL